MKDLFDLSCPLPTSFCNMSFVLPAANTLCNMSFVMLHQLAASCHADGCGSSSSQVCPVPQSSLPLLMKYLCLVSATSAARPAARPAARAARAASTDLQQLLISHGRHQLLQLMRVTGSMLQQPAHGATPWSRHSLHHLVMDPCFDLWVLMKAVQLQTVCVQGWPKQQSSLSSMGKSRVASEAAAVISAKSGMQGLQDRRVVTHCSMPMKVLRRRSLLRACAAADDSILARHIPPGVLLTAWHAAWLFPRGLMQC